MKKDKPFKGTITRAVFHPVPQYSQKYEPNLGLIVSGTVEDHPAFGRTTGFQSSLIVAINKNFAIDEDSPKWIIETLNSHYYLESILDPTEDK